MRFTDAKLRNMKPRAKRYIVWEDNAHGGGTLGVRVSVKGTRSWLHMYDLQGKARMVTLGRYPKMSVAEAHEVFGKAARVVTEGGDPGADVVMDNVRRREAPTVASLATLYIDKWAKPNKRSWERDESMLKRDVLPAIGHVRLEDVRRRHVVAVLDRLQERGAHVQANRFRALLSKMFNFAVGRDLMEYNPCQGVARPSRETAKDRYLSEEEIRTFLAKLPECQMWEGTRLALRFLLTTAQRPGEVIGALWSEIDLEARTWNLPGGRAKNRMAHRVPLSDQAIEILEAARRLGLEGDAVFPSPRTGKVMRNSVLSRAVGRARTVIGIEHFTAHDLRRTAATHMAEAGVSRLVIGKILNHKEAGVTQVYDRHGYDSEKRAALAGWGERLHLLWIGDTLER